METVGTPALWAGFFALILALLALDLGVLHRRPHQMSLREAAGWSAAWIALSALFGLGVWLYLGPDKGLAFAAGYLVEKALSVDNLFVMAVIFSALRILPSQQHRVLFWGILGALVLRLAFILAGGALLSRFHAALYVFGGLLVVTGVKLLLVKDKQEDPQASLAVRALRRVLPVDLGDRTHFFTRRDGRLHATSLLLALVAIEAADIVFAVDSVPAVLAITTDPFIVFTSNVLAILGLRALYFLLGGALDKFRYLKPGVAAILVFVGVKMLIAQVMPVPVAVSLLVIAGVLAVSIAASLLFPPVTRLREAAGASEPRATPRVAP